MRSRLATLVERKRVDGSIYLAGLIGELPVRCEVTGTSRQGDPVWSVYLLTPPAKQQASGPGDRNRRGAEERIARRKAGTVADRAE